MGVDLITREDAHQLGMGGRDSGRLSGEAGEIVPGTIGGKSIAR